MPTDPAVPESPVERAIRNAIEAGEFDDLPGRGRPIDDLHRPYDPAWWARRWVERERAREAAHELAATITRSIPRILASDDEPAVRHELETLAADVAEVNTSLPPEDRIPQVDVERLIDERRARRPFR